MQCASSDRAIKAVTSRRAARLKRGPPDGRCRRALPAQASDRHHHDGLVHTLCMSLDDPCDARNIAERCLVGPLYKLRGARCPACLGQFDSARLAACTSGRSAVIETAIRRQRESGVVSSCVRSRCTHRPARVASDAESGERSAGDVDYSPPPLKESQPVPSSILRSSRHGRSLALPTSFFSNFEACAAARQIRLGNLWRSPFKPSPDAAH